MNGVLVQKSVQNHIHLFRLLALALSYPDQDFINRLQAQIGNINVEVTGDRELSLRAFIEELTTLEMLPLDQIQGEHTRLFINAYPKIPCPPYETVYREGVLFGQAAEDVYQFYQRWGIQAQSGEVDHAGSELEFMAYLLALESPDALQEADRFINIHLAAWLPAFANDLAQQSRLSFYRQLGILMKEILLKSGICS